MRQCVGCHEMKAKKEMIRVIKTASEEEPEKVEISLDTTGRKNGRGAYICPNSECLNAAIKSIGRIGQYRKNVPEYDRFLPGADVCLCR